MEFKELVCARKSIRRFLSEPITQNEIVEIIQTATNACNSGNQQYWRFIVIRSDAVKNKIAQVVRNKAEWLNNETNKVFPSQKSKYISPEFYLEAPVVIGIVATAKYRTKPDLLMRNLGYDDRQVDDLRCRGDMQTIGAVTQLILLAAWEKGLGGCWMTGPLFARKELEALLEIPAGETLAALVPLGKPAVIPSGGSRKPVDEVIAFVD